MSAISEPPVDVALAMYVDDERRECAHSTIKRLGMTPLERTLLWPLVHRNSWASTYHDISEACSHLHMLLQTDADRLAGNEALARAGLSFRLLQKVGIAIRLPREIATPPAKRARLA